MSLWAGLALGVGCAAGALGARWGLARLWPALGRAWCYRAAVMGSCALGVAAWTAWRGFSPLALVASAVGAFAGGLLATAMGEGLWEDSFPPPPEMAAAVLARHRVAFEQPAPEPRAKRPLDVTLALLGLALTAPLWPLIAALIWFEDPGPILFVKNSVGRGGVTFRQLKFRSMVHAAEAHTGPVPTYVGDPRTLWVGRVLRRTGLDELPQTINILRGEMSLVGPRPLRTVVIHGYLAQWPEFVGRHRVRPGITGLSQVRAGYAVEPLERLRHDQEYIGAMSVGRDLEIMLRTLWVVLRATWRHKSGQSPLHF